MDTHFDLFLVLKTQFIGNPYPKVYFWKFHCLSQANIFSRDPGDLVYYCVPRSNQSTKGQGEYRGADGHRVGCSRNQRTGENSEFVMFLVASKLDHVFLPVERVVFSALIPSNANFYFIIKSIWHWVVALRWKNRQHTYIKNEVIPPRTCSFFPVLLIFKEKVQLL